MHLDPLWNAGPVVAGHALMALAAFGIGLVQFARPKGTGGHRAMGALWLGLMTAVALSALFISEIGTFGYFSWIHLLVPVTLGSVAYGLWAARRGKVAAHAATMVFLFVGALGVAGAFTFLPYRVMNDVVTGRSLAD